MWNQIACNLHYEDYLKAKESKRLFKSLRGIRPIVDTSGPKKVPHLKKRSKKAQLREARQEEINFSNQILMEKMFSIDARSVNPHKSIRPHSQFSLNKKNRSKNNIRINEENQKILERLQNAQPSFSLEKWEKDERNWVNLRNNIVKKRRKSRPQSTFDLDTNDLVMKILKRRTSRPSTALNSELV